MDNVEDPTHKQNRQKEVSLLSFRFVPSAGKALEKNKAIPTELKGEDKKLRKAACGIPFGEVGVSSVRLQRFVEASNHRDTTNHMKETTWHDATIFGFFKTVLLDALFGSDKSRYPIPKLMFCWSEGGRLQLGQYV